MEASEQRDPQTYAIIGAAMEVHRELGAGFLALTGTHKAQVINYLKATGLTRALLLNFGADSLEHKRLVLNHPC